MMRVTKLLMALLLLLIAMADCSGAAETKDDLVPAGNDNVQIFTDTPLDPLQKFADDLQEAIPAELTAEKFELIYIEGFDKAPIGPIDPQRAEGWPVVDGEGIIITLGPELAS